MEMVRPIIAAGTFLQNLFTVFMNSGGTYVTTTTSNASLEFGEPVTYTASVTAGVVGSGSPTGTVSFFDSSTLLGSAPIQSGEASITVPSLSVTTHTIIAIYSGDSHFNPHTAAPLTQRVQQAPTQISFSFTQGSPTGLPVTFSGNSHVANVRRADWYCHL